LEIGLAACKGRQAPGTLPFNQGLKGLPEQGSALKRAAELLGLCQQLIIQGDGGAHLHTQPTVIIIGIS
jgi:hypothetical protein